MMYSCTAASVLARGVLEIALVQDIGDGLLLIPNHLGDRRDLQKVGRLRLTPLFRSDPRRHQDRSHPARS